ncbi:HD-GYP domain-containing protein [Cohnella sp. CFH 77786]|uniref:HD-GYP domain-containing protein n=1 Tax=Cohnella sp. CFH 77786 TaxID=2662265 RepID=UPI001C60AB43|nr:HD domain-containing phosphohydrolase [Cohnella sp. CFH 77786]
MPGRGVMNMLLVPVHELKDGDRLGRGLYSGDGRLLLKQGIRLNDRMIEGIKRLGLNYIYVEISDNGSGSAGRDWKRNLRAVTGELLDRCFQAIRRNGTFPAKPLFDWAEHLSGIVTEKPDFKLGPGDLTMDQEELIAHSLNVCFLSMLTAKALGYGERLLREVAIGSLLHDIGLAVPLEDKLVMNHPLIGFDILRKVPGIPTNALQIVLQHHERIDGRGFPQGIRGRAFREASQICAVACEFDDFMNRSLTPRLPEEGFDYVMSKIDTSYDYGVVRAFLRIFEPYPVGTAVKLTGNLEGTVIETNPANPNRPVVQLRATGGRIDLMRHPTLRIERAQPANP